VKLTLPSLDAESRRHGALHPLNVCVFMTRCLRQKQHALSPAELRTISKPQSVYFETLCTLTRAEGISHTWLLRQYCRWLGSFTLYSESRRFEPLAEDQMCSSSHSFPAPHKAAMTARNKPRHFLSQSLL
jgi:hypothetical protein